MSERKTFATETKIAMSDPTALGVFGLSMITFVAASQKLGWTTGTAFIIPWAVFLGAIGQIWASLVDFKKNNYFGSIVLGPYGLFWMGVAAHWAISLGWFGDIGEADPKQLGFAFFGYFIFSLFITVASFETNKCFAAILVLIDVLLFSLAMNSWGIAPEIFSMTAAYSELLISLIGFYAAGGFFLNNFFERQILPPGKPFGFIKKGPIETHKPARKLSA